MRESRRTELRVDDAVLISVSDCPPPKALDGNSTVCGLGSRSGLHEEAGTNVRDRGDGTISIVRGLRLTAALPAFLAALALALGLVFSQSVSSPWWITA